VAKFVLRNLPGEERGERLCFGIYQDKLKSLLRIYGNSAEIKIGFLMGIYSKTTTLALLR
jgi:hypothetical protein